MCVETQELRGEVGLRTEVGVRVTGLGGEGKGEWGHGGEGGPLHTLD